MGCGCGATSAVLDGNSVVSDGGELLRASVLAYITGLGSADPCPETREFIVRPRTAPAKELFTTRTGPVAGYAPDLVNTYATVTEALDAAIVRLGQVGGTLLNGCP